MPQQVYIEAPAEVPATRIGRLLTSVPVVNDADPKVGFGVVYDRAITNTVTAQWPSPCETPGVAKETHDLSLTVVGIPFTVTATGACRALVSWEGANERQRQVFEAAEVRGLESAFEAALSGGDYGPVVDMTSPTTAPIDVLATAEELIAGGDNYGAYVLANPAIVTYLISRGVVFRVGEHLETALGTRVIALYGLLGVYVTGAIYIWRSRLIQPDPVLVSPYDNEYKALTERIYTIAVETTGGDDIVRFPVDYTGCCTATTP